MAEAMLKLAWYHKIHNQQESCRMDEEEDDDEYEYEDEDEDEDEYDYQFLGVISRGAFGIVHKALNKETKRIVAMKEELEGLSPTTRVEIDILKTLGPHPCIVGFERVAKIPTERGGAHVFVVMECMKSDLERWREDRGKPYSLVEIKHITKRILNGVAFLHGNGVMHRDLKPANVLVGDRWEVKICDFGLSARFGPGPARPRDPNVGTLWYKAPELLLGSRTHTCAVDIWSVGCIMAALVVDHPFFPGFSDAEQLDYIGRAVKPPFNFLRQKMAAAAKYSEAAAALTPAGLDLLKRLLAYEAEKRITARDALDHAWFSET